ncbi:MAG TPA: bifunctional 3'-5' exonuclease/DNA polymerase [Micromonosporaceae bacterium]|nr:bifunctional 3'-5' exonuclease/DNA polymerase [Micromonosporaceae bacterium]
MLIAAAARASDGDLASSTSGRFALQGVQDDGTPCGERWLADDLAIPAANTAAASARLALDSRARWLWPSTPDVYPALLQSGGCAARAHDLELTEALLLGAEGDWGAPRSLAAAWARLVGAPVPPDPPSRPPAPPGDEQGTLFEPMTAASAPAGIDPLTATIRVYADQLTRIAKTPHPGRFRLLVAAESAGALLAVEMGRDGLPWDADVHEALLRDLLGEPSPGGAPPRRLAVLADEISQAFGGVRLRPDSPAEVLRAFRQAGFAVSSTRAWELRGIDHPAVPLVRRYKELYRIWTAHGWAWRQAWVRDGRFRAEYVPAGVVSGRWATRGGGALQIPRVIRAAVRADPGWKLVVADAGQLEPRILAAVSGDGRMMRAAGTGDMYEALATESFAGDRAVAKVALLGAMYGQTGGQAVPALATLRRSYGTAFAYVEDAARVGEAGGLVRSWLGRTCPPPSAGWTAATWAGSAEEADTTGPNGDADGLGSGDGFGRVGAASRSDAAGRSDARGRGGAARARARGRFTRNFVIQATAAEWALVLLATLRTALLGSPARIVFFQHDEVIVHAPVELAEEVAATVQAAATEASRLLFGDTPVRFPLGVAIVDSYADAK